MSQGTAGAAGGGGSVLLRRLALNAAALLVVLSAGEAAVRLAPPEPVRASHHVLEPGRSFRTTAPPRGPDGVVEWDREITLNRFGFHGPDHGPLRAPGKARVAVIGDSMVEAFQVAREETLAARLEEGLPGVEVLGFGMSGHSTVRQDRILARLPDLLREGGTVDLPDVAVFAVHGPYAVRQTLVDFVRPAALWRRGLSWALLHYGGPSRLLLLARDSVLMRLGVPTEDLLAEARNAFRPDHRSALLDRSWELLGESVSSLAAWCRRRGVRPVFAYIPDVSELPAPGPAMDTDAVKRRFEALVREAGADWVDLTGGMRREAGGGGAPLFFRWDQHLTARGHSVAASLLARELEPLLGKAGREVPPLPPK